MGKTASQPCSSVQGRGGDPGRVGGLEVRSQMAQGKSCFWLCWLCCVTEGRLLHLSAAQPHLERAVPMVSASRGVRRTRWADAGRMPGASETSRVWDVWRRGCGQREEGTAVPGPLAPWPPGCGH